MSDSHDTHIDVLSRIIERIISSPLPPTYQEFMLNRIHDLRPSELRTIEKELIRIQEASKSYERAAVQWLNVCGAIALRIERKIQLTAAQVVLEFEAELQRRLSRR